MVKGRRIEEVGHQFDRDVVGDDPSASYDASAQVADDAFGTAGRDGCSDRGVAWTGVR
jgi:hypothetical protein